MFAAPDHIGHDMGRERERSRGYRSRADGGADGGGAFVDAEATGQQFLPVRGERGRYGRRAAEEDHHRGTMGEESGLRAHLGRAGDIREILLRLGALELFHKRRGFGTGDTKYQAGNPQRPGSVQDPGQSHQLHGPRPYPRQLRLCRSVISGFHFLFTRTYWNYA